MHDAMLPIAGKTLVPVAQPGAPLLTREPDSRAIR